MSARWAVGAVAALVWLVPMHVRAAEMRGCIGFCEALGMSAEERVAIATTESALLDRLASPQLQNGVLNVTGYELKAAGMGVPGIELGHTVIGDVVPDVVADVAARLSQEAVSAAEVELARSIVLDLDKRIPALVDNGRVDLAKLANVTNAQLRFVGSPAFQQRIGNPTHLLEHFDPKSVNAKTLVAVLSGAPELRDGVAKINKRIDEIDRAVGVLTSLQNGLVLNSEQAQQTLGLIDKRLGAAATAIGSLRETGVSAERYLALGRAGALNANLDEQLAGAFGEADGIATRFHSYGTGLRDVSVALGAVGLGEMAAQFSTASDIMEQSGTLAVAWATGDYFGGAVAAIGIVGKLGGFGRKKNGDAKMLAQLMKALEALNRKIDTYHQREMAMLEQIDLKLDRLYDLSRTEFAEISTDLDMAYVATLQILSKDTETCRQLDAGFANLIGTNPGLDRNEFARWFETENRSGKWRECIDGLLSTLPVPSERKFNSTLVRTSSDIESVPRSGGDAAEQIDQMVQQVMVPTSAYLRRHFSEEQMARRVAMTYAPVLSVCTALDMQSVLCEVSSQAMVPSRLKETKYEPGGGAWLSDQRVLELAGWSRRLGAWNTALHEGNGGALVSQVIPTSDLANGRYSAQMMGMRTDHLEVLRHAADALDLVMGQAQQIGGTVALARAAALLDEQVLPVYAQARLTGKTEALEALLKPGRTGDPRLGPNCATGGFGHDTLCLMQTNPWFATNVMKAVLVRRLAQNNVSRREWVAAARLPSSPRLNELMGNDVLFLDGAIPMHGNVFAAWTVQLPRVNLLAKPKADDLEQTYDCWRHQSLPGDEQARKDFYGTPQSAHCHALPLISEGALDRLSYPVAMDSLLFERQRIDLALRAFCEGLSTYPATTCQAYRRAVAAAAN